MNKEYEEDRFWVVSHHEDAPENYLVGIVDEEMGGVVAYVQDEDVAHLMVKALKERAAKSRKVILTVEAEYRGDVPVAEIERQLLLSGKALYNKGMLDNGSLHLINYVCSVNSEEPK